MPEKPQPRTRETLRTVIALADACLVGIDETLRQSEEIAKQRAKETQETDLEYDEAVWALRSAGLL